MYRKAKLSVMAALMAQLLFASSVHSGLIDLDNRQAQRQFLTGPVAEQRHSLNLVSVSPLIVEDQAIGEVVVYDDPSTKRPADYFGLYDLNGELVAVGWFDQFGIQRIAVDRNLVDDTDGSQGAFVYLIGGQLV
ncbi:MAG TPA: hypothetical protein VLX11_11735 [Candidatus Acidoferrales bacterium]|nr:hypothetical protein [Candidatus Acidoferrales bacterium]